MKKTLLLIFTICGFMFLANKTDADCWSCDTYIDNGHCDRSDINNKFCGIGSPKDCYSANCLPPNEN